MEPVEKDLSPSDEWLQSLTAACNRLSTQYLNLLKSASSVAALQNYDEGSTDRSATATTSRHDPRAGGGHMMTADAAPPPPLAADIALHSALQCQLSVENICVASSQILTLIRTLRLSLLLMDDETMRAEERLQVEQTQQLTQEATRKALELEHEYMELLNKELE